MIAWERLGSADPVGGNPDPASSDRGSCAPLELWRRGQEFSLRVAGAELMNSRMHASEDALATLVCDRLSGQSAPRLLVGGLGMGFTLAAALAGLSADARVLVAELIAEVVEWNRGPLAELAGRPLSDPRVEVRVEDVAVVVGENPARFDGILLDVDNGPDALVAPGNAGLYSPSGLAGIFAGLRPKGLLAVWSAAPDKGFERRLRGVGFSVEEVALRAHQPTRGARHTVWIAQK